MRSARAAVLAAWRGVDVEPLVQAQTLVARTVAEVLSAVQDTLGLDRRRVETEVVKVWQTLDPALVAHARPTSLRRRTLFVSVDSSPWLEEIVRYRQREILDRLHQCFGREVIDRISFRIG